MALELPMTLYPERWKTFLYALLCLGFAAIGFLMVREGRAEGWLALLLFGPGTVLFLIQLLPNASFLVIRHDGFEYTKLFRKSFVRWEDVTDIGVLTMRQSGIAVHRTVGFNFASGRTPLSTGKKLARALAGFEATLPDTYGMKAAELARLFSSLRDEWLRARSGTG